MDQITNKNIELLKQKYPHIYSEIQKFKNNDRHQILDCANGCKTARVSLKDRSILIHSKYNPVIEAEKFAVEKLANQKKINVLYGFGMGYHVLQMLKKLDDSNSLYVFDINIEIFKDALSSIDLSAIFEEDRICLSISSDLTNILKDMEEVFSLSEDINVILHVPSVQTIPDELEDFKFVLEDWNMRKSVDDKYTGLLYDNYVSNRKNITRNIGEFFGKFTGMPFLIVSAGPSLDKNIELIKGVKNKAVIISVGSAVKALLGRGIRPDFFVLVDPLEHVSQQIEGIEQVGIPAVFLATACKSAVERYQGPKFIAAQDPAYAVEGEQAYLVNTGGSVATTSIDIALKMGASQVILVGQDLAFSENKYHSEGYAHEFGKGKVNPMKNMRTVQGVNGETLYTTLGLLSYKRWIENRIADERDIDFINATEGGAFIKGAEHRPLRDVIDKYLKKTYDIQTIISRIINKG